MVNTIGFVDDLGYTNNVSFVVADRHTKNKLSFVSSASVYFAVKPEIKKISVSNSKNKPKRKGRDETKHLVSTVAKDSRPIAREELKVFTQF